MGSLKKKSYHGIVTLYCLHKELNTTQSKSITARCVWIFRLKKTRFSTVGPIENRAFQASGLRSLQRSRWWLDKYPLLLSFLLYSRKFQAHSRIITRLIIHQITQNVGIFHVTSRTQNKPLSNFHDSHARLPCALTRSLSILACWSKTWPNCIEGQQGLLGCHRVPTKRSEIIINYVRNMAKIYNDDLQEATSKAVQTNSISLRKKVTNVVQTGNHTNIINKVCYCSRRAICWHASADNIWEIKALKL